MTGLAPPELVLIHPAHPFTNYESPTIIREPAPGIMRGTEKGQLDWRSEFTRRFREDAISAVKEVTQHVLLHREDAEAAVSLLLPYLIKSSYAQRNLVFNALMDFATPQDLLFAALAIPERERDPRILRIAAELLEHYGAEATPVLTRLARSGRQECRYFLGTILNMEAPERRREALLALAEHPDLRTRQELLDEADRASSEDAMLVCRRLALDPEELIRESAREKLIYLES